MDQNGSNGTSLAIDRDKKADTTLPKYEPTEKEKKIINSVNRKFKERDTYRRPFEKTWFTTHAALVGQYFLVWNDRTGTFESPMRAPGNRVRYCPNMAMPYWRRSKARLTAHRPGLHVQPATNDEENAERARVNLHVLEGEMERLEYQKHNKNSVGHMLETGTAIHGFRWDPWAGRPLTEQQPVVDTMTGMPQLDQMQQPVMEEVPVTDEHGRQLHEGEIVQDVYSSFEFDIDPSATCMDDAAWVRIDKIRTLDWIKEQYPEFGMYVKAEDVYANQLYLKRQKQLVGVGGSVKADGDEGPKNSAVVHEHWERPTPKYPKGHLVVVAGGVLLHDGENPYTILLENGIPYPFSERVEVRIPGRFLGMAMLELLIPIIKNLGKARSQEIENRAIHGRPKILIPRVNKIRPGSFSSEAGEKIEYTPGPQGQKPETMYPQSTSQATQNEIVNSTNDLQGVGSWHDASQGIMPSANAPAAAVDKLQQADETALGETEGNLRDATIRDGKIILCLAAQLWTEERLVRATGDDGAIVARTVRGSDMTGNGLSANFFDVRMIPQSTMWRDPVQQRKMVDEMIKMGVLDPVANRRTILKMLDQASIEEIFKDDQLDQANSNRENDLMAQANMVQARDFENHAIHLQQHNRFRKTERYRGLPPEIRAIFDQHVLEHEAMEVQNLQKQSMMQVQAQAPAMQAQMAMQGGPGPDPAAGGPPPQ